MTSVVGSLPTLQLHPRDAVPCCPTHSMQLCPPYSPDKPSRSLSETAKEQQLMAAASCELATPMPRPDRLAAVNNFKLYPDEPQRSMQELVQALMAELDGDKPKNLERIYNIMMSYDYAGNEWKRFEHWNADKKYTRNLIALVPGSFCLMLLCWNPERGSPIHNHASSECMMRVLQGAIVEKQFIVKGQEGDAEGQHNWNKLVCSNIPLSDLRQTHENVYETSGCTFINDSLGVHQVENPYKERAVTLHAYIPGYDTCKAWMPDAANPESVKCQLSTISFDTEQGEEMHQ